MRKNQKNIILSRRASAIEYSKTHPPREKIIRLCCVDGCDRRCDSFSFCNRHYQEWLQYGHINENPIIKTLKGETWRDIIGYEGLYKISNFGRVLSLPRESRRRRNGKITTMRVKSRIMSLDIDCKGYCRVHLSIDGKCTTKLIHRLVAEAFLPNPKGYPQINHIDCNPSNNRLENLEWCDQSMQEIHKIITTGRGSRSLVYQPVPVKNIDTGEEFSSIGDAFRKTEVPVHIIFNRLKTGKPDNNGHHWEYMVN